MKMIVIRILPVLAVTSFLVVFIAGCTNDEESEINSFKNETNSTVYSLDLPDDSRWNIITDGVELANGFNEVDPSNFESLAGIEYSSGSSIRFYGTSTLPDGTVLVSRFFEDDTRLSWWPVDQEAKINDGKWEFFVEAGGAIAASDLEILEGPSHYFYIWEKGDPELKAVFSFDLGTHPRASISREIRFTLDSGSSIRFSGTSALPDGTVLVSQLFEEDTPLSWWPEDREIQVNGGKWELFVEAGGAITASDLVLYEAASFSFYIWEKGRPETKKVFSFDLFSTSSYSIE